MLVLGGSSFIVKRNTSYRILSIGISILRINSLLLQLNLQQIDSTNLVFLLKHIQVISDSKGTRTHNHVVCKPTPWRVWLSVWVFVYELSRCGFESCCCHFNFRYRACFEQGVTWHSGNCRVWIRLETRTWHHNDIQSTESSIVVV